MGAGDAVFASVLAEIATRGLGEIEWYEALKRAMRIAAATIAHPGALLRLPE
jgi:fructokinase